MLVTNGLGEGRERLRIVPAARARVKKAGRAARGAASPGGNDDNPILRGDGSRPDDDGVAGVSWRLRPDRAVDAGQTPAPAYSSRVILYDLDDKASRVVYEADTVWEAPNWSRDGRFLLSNSGGKLYRVPVDGRSRRQRSRSIRRCAATTITISRRTARGSRSRRHLRRPASRRSMSPTRMAQVCDWSLLAAPSYFTAGRRMASTCRSSPTGTASSTTSIVCPSRAARRSDSPSIRRTTTGLTIRAMANGSISTRTAAVVGTSGGSRRTAPAPDDRNAQQVTNDDLEDWFPHPSPDGQAGCCFSRFRTAPRVTTIATSTVQIRMIEMPGETMRHAKPRVMLELPGGTGDDQREFLVAGLEALRLCDFPGQAGRSMMLEPRVQTLVETVWDYHHLGHTLSPADAILVLCSHDEVVARTAARSSFSTAGRRC